SSASPSAEKGRVSASPASAQTPKYPPNSTARSAAAAPPARCSTCPTGTPIPISSTHGSRTAPITVTSIEPGSADVPAERNHEAPQRGRGGRRDAALYPVHNRARLAAGEPVRRSADPDAHSVETGMAALGRGVVDDLADRTMHDDDCLAGPGQLRRERRAVEHELR